jgi:nitrogen fixation NifU-like protein
VSDLEDLYREIILDHYRSPRNRGELPSPPAHRLEGFNPLCGDEVVLTLLVEDDQVADIKIGGAGCSISQSSASLMSAAVKGKSIDEATALIRTFKSMMSIHEAALGGPDEKGSEADGDDEDSDATGLVDLSKLGELAALQGVVKFPVRIKCATLCWNVLSQVLAEANSPTS